MTDFEKMIKNAPIDYSEIFKLDKMLTEASIPHTLLPTDAWMGKGWQIRAYYDEAMTRELDDCVIHRYSHGAFDGLLESFRASACDGYETAEKIFKAWKKMYKKGA